MAKARLLAAALALTVAAPASAADWSAPTAISNVTSFISAPALAFDPSGRGLAAWDEQAGLGNSANNRVEYAARDRSGRFARPRSLGADLFLGGVALDRRGRSLVLAVHSKAGRQDRMESFTDFAKPQVLRTSPYTFMRTPKLAANSAGAAAAIWRELPSRQKSSDVAMLATRTAGHAFGRARRVSQAGVTDVEVAMAPNGEFVVAWVRRGLAEARLGRGSKLGPVMRLSSNAGIRAKELAVAMDGAGRALVAWKSFIRSSGTSLVRVAYSTASRRFHPGKETARWSTRVGETAGIRAAFYAKDRAVIAWDGGDADGNGVFAATTTLWSPGSSHRLSPVATQPAPGESDQLQTVAAGGGTAAVAWTHMGPEGAATDSQGHLLVSDLTATRQFSLQPVTGPAVDALDATLAFSPRDGSAVAIWRTKTTNQAFVSPREYVGTATRR